jgi:hypothetical protein
MTIGDHKDLFVDEYDYLPIPTTYKVSIIDYDSGNDLDCYKYEILDDEYEIKDKFINYMLEKGYKLK